LEGDQVEEAQEGQTDQSQVGLHPSRPGDQRPEQQSDHTDIDGVGETDFRQGEEHV